MAAVYDISSVDPDALNLKNMMDQVLEKVTSVFTSFGVPLPSRCYWTMGAPAIDCEQLVVSFVQVYLGPPGVHRGVTCQELRFLLFPLLERYLLLA